MISLKRCQVAIQFYFKKTSTSNILLDDKSLSDLKLTLIIEKSNFVLVRYNIYYSNIRVINKCNAEKSSKMPSKSCSKNLGNSYGAFNQVTASRV